MSDLLTRKPRSKLHLEPVHSAERAALTKAGLDPNAYVALVASVPRLTAKPPGLEDLVAAEYGGNELVTFQVEVEVPLQLLRALRVADRLPAAAKLIAGRVLKDALGLRPMVRMVLRKDALSVDIPLPPAPAPRPPVPGARHAAEDRLISTVKGTAADDVEIIDLNPRPKDLP